MQKKLTLIIFLLFLSVLILAQPLCTLKEYTLNDGYSHGRVNNFIQDRNGLIWLGTRDGLIQFDGYTFKSFKSYPGDGIAMGSSNISSIYENSQGDIWCQNEDGRIYLFDVKRNQFIDVLKYVESTSEKFDKVFPLAKGITWLISKNGKCYRVDDIVCKDAGGVTLQQVKGKSIYAIFQDVDNDEWILTNQGISIFGEKTISLDNEFVEADVSDNVIWLSGYDGDFARYDCKTGNMDFINLFAEMQNITAVNLLNDSIVAVGILDNGLFIFNINEETFKQINVDVLPQSKNNVYSIFQDSKGDLWMQNQCPGIIHYCKKNGKVSILKSPPNNNLKFDKPNKAMVWEDLLGNVWVIPTGGNLCYFDRDDQKLKYYYSSLGNSKSIICPQIRDFMFDNQGNLWFDDDITLGRISFFKNNFHLIPKEKDEFEIRSLLLDRNKNIWVGAKKNKLRVLNENNECIGYVAENGAISETPVSFNSNVYCMFEDDGGNIWIGTRSNGLYLFKPKNNHEFSFDVHHFMNDPQNNYSLSNNSVFSIFQDKSDRIWIGTYGGGINLVQQNKSGDYQFIHNQNRLKTYPTNNVSCVRYICEIGENVIVVATTNGMLSFSSNFSEPEGICFYQNVRRPDDPMSLNNNDIRYVFEDNEKRLFILTRNGGINQLVSQNLLSDSILFKSFTVKDGLLSDLSLSMIAANDSSVCLVSQHDLCKYYPEQGRIDYLNSFINNQDISFSEAPPIRNASGNMMFATNKGIIEFNDQSSLEGVLNPEMIFTKILVQGAKLKESAHYFDELIMNSSQRNISIEFAALDYRNPQQIQYAYQMEGIDEEWYYVGSNRSASYINLQPGKYQFKVKSTNSEGIWVNNVRSLSITVEPTFFQTIWAWVIIVIIIVCCIILVIYVFFTFFRLRHELEVEQKITDIKLKFYTEIAHELRTPLTLITSPVTEVLETFQLPSIAKNHLTIVKKNADRMLRIVNQILDFRKIQNNKMKLLVEDTELVSFITSIMENFQSLADEKQINFQLNTSDENIHLWVDRDKFEKIIFNLLSNAFKFTPDGQSILVQIRKEHDRAILSVIDKGIGIHSQKIDLLFSRFDSIVQKDMLNSSSGIGLALVKELVELHKGTLQVFSQIDKGSEFRISFILGCDHFKNDKNTEFILSEDLPRLPDKTTNKVAKIQTLKDKGKWTILVVEDNLDLLEFLKVILSDFYFVFEAHNGVEGLEKAKSVIPDIIISDILMPGKDGLEMVKEIKDNRDLCHIPIILLSSKNSLDDRIKGLENGIDDYISKPFSTSYLKARIHSLIKQRELLQKTFLLQITSDSLVDVEKRITPSLPQISSYDDEFIRQLMDFMEQNMENPSLLVDDIAFALSISRTVLYKKVKMLLGISPNDFIKNVRIKRAIQLMDSGVKSVSDVAYRCGFSSPFYFAKCFRKETGKSPSDYMKG